MTKTQFSTYTPSKNGKRSIEEAISELQREMDTRKRILDRWVNEGKLSWVDAHDRFERHLSALALLIRYSNELDQAEREQDNAAIIIDGEPSILSIDTPAEQVAA